MAKVKAVENWSRSYVPTRFHKIASRFPLYFWRMGLSSRMGRYLMVLTTFGRKSHLPRTVMVQYYDWRGRLYIISGYGNRTDWFKNLQANPHVMVQTSAGNRPMLARRITGEDELAEVFELIQSSKVLRGWLTMQGIELTLPGFLAHRDDLYLVTFDPTSEPAPPPVKNDLWWVWLVLVAAMLLLKRPARRKSGERPL